MLVAAAILRNPFVPRSSAEHGTSSCGFRPFDRLRAGGNRRSGALGRTLASGAANHAAAAVAFRRQ
jgi:hypothetical protein